MADSLRERELTAEAATIRDLLRRTPVGPLGSVSLSKRLRRVESELEAERAHPLHTALLDFVFDGEPVVSNVGIEAGFASRAIDALVRAVTAELNSEQRVREEPANPVHGLFITEQIRGSFGFRLEELGQRRLSGHSDLSQAVTRVSDAIARASGDTGSEWSNDLSRPTLVAIRNLFSVLKSRQVKVRLSYNGAVAVMDHAAISAGAERTASIDVEEHEEWVTGVLSGVASAARTFELTPVAGSAFSGRIATDIDYYGQVFPKLEQRCEVQLRITERRHAGRTIRTYLLIGIGE